MNRQELIEKLMWNDGGVGLGITPIATSFMLNLMKPKSKEDDWKSVVAVSGPPEKYTNKELQKLVDFSERRTAIYDEMFSYRMGCNLIHINKYDENTWLRKRTSWDMGPMFSKSLDEAMSVFDK